MRLPCYHAPSPATTALPHRLPPVQPPTRCCHRRQQQGHLHCWACQGKHLPMVVCILVGCSHAIEAPCWPACRPGTRCAAGAPPHPPPAGPQGSDPGCALPANCNLLQPLPPSILHRLLGLHDLCRAEAGLQRPCAIRCSASTRPRPSAAGAHLSSKWVSPGFGTRRSGPNNAHALAICHETSSQRPTP